MSDRCAVCGRPRLGSPPSAERPCHVPLGPRCYEVAYDRLKARLGKLATDPVIKGRIAVIEMEEAARG
jgi:hypothetical protein